MIYSFSRLDSTDGKYGCWWKFYLRYILNIPSSPGEPLIFGKACHSVIEGAIKAGDSDYLDILSETVASASDINVDEVKKCVMQDAVYQAIKEGGEVETYFEMPLDDFPDSPVVRGYIDFFQIDSEKIILTDWKTNRATYLPTDNAQVGLYAKYLSQKYHLPVVGRLGFLRFKKIEEHEYTEADMDEATNWAMERALECDSRQIKLARGADPLEIFPKQTGSCEYCEYKNLCLADVPMLSDITTPHEALKAAQAIMLQEEQLKAKKDKLKAFINTSGPQENNLCRVSIETSEYLRFDLAARKNVVAEMLAQGLEIGSILKIGSDAQNDLFKLGWTQDDFKNLGAKPGSTSRLTLTTKKGGKEAV